MLTMFTAINVNILETKLVCENCRQITIILPYVQHVQWDLFLQLFKRV